MRRVHCCGCVSRCGLFAEGLPGESHARRPTSAISVRRRRGWSAQGLRRRVGRSAGGTQVLKKPHPIYGNVAGKASYAIRRVSFLAPRLATIVESCAAAAESTDARDKYFLSSPSFAVLCLHR